MSQINTNVAALIAQHNLGRANQDLSVRLERLATGLRINRGADDPAGLIVSERLRAEISGIGKAIDNIERASNVIATGEASLQEANNLLNDIKGLVIEAANTGAFSDEEVQANQIQIDSAIESIARIANTTSFAGLKLLDGSLDYILEDIVTSQMNDVNVYSARFGNNEQVPVNVEVLNSAQRAELFWPGDADGTSAGALTQSISFEIKGNAGVEYFSFASGTSLSAVAYAVNNIADATGVQASLLSAADPTSGMLFTSTGYGSDAYVSVEVREGGENFQAYDEPGGDPVSRQTGQDVLALVNGNLALGRGLDVSVRTGALDLSLSLTSAAAQTLNETFSFNITGGGATYQVGPQVNTHQQASFGIGSVAPSRLGDSIVGFLASVQSGRDNALTSGDDVRSQAQAAGAIIDAAIDQISQMRGRLGAFERNTLQTTLRSSQIAIENLTAAESSIRDADFAAETSRLTRAQILQQAGTQTLGIANDTAANVLTLLG